MFSKVASGVLKRVEFALSPQMVTTPALNFNVAAQSKPSIGKVVAVIDTVVDRIALSNLPTSIALKLRNRDYVIGRRFYSKKPGSDVENEVEVNSHSAVPYEVHAEALEEIGSLKARLKTKSDTLWIVTCRAAIKDFEDAHGYDAVIDKTKILAQASYFEKNRRRRALRFSWIFQNKSSERRVATLIKKIDDSKLFKSPDDFAEYISFAYDDLSVLLKNRILIPGSADYIFKYITLDPNSNRAIEVFMSMLEIREDMVIPRKG